MSRPVDLVAGCVVEYDDGDKIQGMPCAGATPLSLGGWLRGRRLDADIAADTRRRCRCCVCWRHAVAHARTLCRLREL